MRRLPVLRDRLPLFVLPNDHQPVVRTPPGGSSCANCRWVGQDYRHCVHPLYQRWMGTSALPGPADQVCSDWWESL